MTSVSESRIGKGLLPGLVSPLKESGNLGGALRVAGDGAVALAQGSTAAGLLVTSKGLELAKDVAARTARVRKDRASLLKTVVAEKPQKRTRPGRRSLIVFGALGAVAAGGAVFYRSRRPDHPPIAPEPPRVKPVETGDVPTLG